MSQWDEEERWAPGAVGLTGPPRRAGRRPYHPVHFSGPADELELSRSLRKDDFLISWFFFFLMSKLNIFVSICGTVIPYVICVVEAGVPGLECSGGLPLGSILARTLVTWGSGGRLDSIRLLEAPSPHKAGPVLVGVLVSGKAGPPPAGPAACVHLPANCRAVPPSAPRGVAGTQGGPSPRTVFPEVHGEQSTCRGEVPRGGLC